MAKSYVFSDLDYQTYWSKNKAKLQREKARMEKSLGCSLGKITLVDDCEYSGGTVIPS
jgi:hypothetical protein